MSINTSAFCVWKWCNQNNDYKWAIWYTRKSDAADIRPLFKWSISANFITLMHVVKNIHTSLLFVFKAAYNKLN